MKSRDRREARSGEGKSGILVLVKIRVLGVKMNKERGDRVWVERSAREEGDEIEAEYGGILRYASDRSASSFFFFFSVFDENLAPWTMVNTDA